MLKIPGGKENQALLQISIGINKLLISDWQGVALQLASTPNALLNRIRVPRVGQSKLGVGPSECCEVFFTAVGVAKQGYVRHHCFLGGVQELFCIHHLDEVLPT